MPASRPAIAFPGEPKSNEIRASLTQAEPIALRTFTPSQVVISKSAGVFHWTSDGRRLYDYSSGVLVSNLGHNPRRWLQRFAQYLGWKRIRHRGLLFGEWGFTADLVSGCLRRSCGHRPP